MVDCGDKTWWMGDKSSLFIVKSTYELLRRRRQELHWPRNVWIKVLHLKISFFLWRAWKKRITTHDNWKRMKSQIVSRCYYCEDKEMETMSHLFLTAPSALQLWKHFATYAGIQCEGMCLQQLICSWWNLQGSTKFKLLIKAVLAIVMWQI